MRALLIGVGVALAVWVISIVLLVVMGRKMAAKALARLLPNLVALLRGLIGDERVPKGARWALRVALVWVLSPVDLVPEFIPIVGPLDDVIVVALALRYAARRAGPRVVRDHWKGGEEGLRMILRLAGLREIPA